MTGVCRVDDSLSTGHICSSSTTIASSNNDNSVRTNNSLRIIIVEGAPTEAHPFPPRPPCAAHTAQLNTGSPNVNINGEPVGRINDSADLGQMTSGSSTVFANGS